MRGGRSPGPRFSGFRCSIDGQTTRPTPATGASMSFCFFSSILPGRRRSDDQESAGSTMTWQAGRQAKQERIIANFPEKDGIPGNAAKPCRCRTSAGSTPARQKPPSFFMPRFPLSAVETWQTSRMPGRARELAPAAGADPILRRVIRFSLTANTNGATFANARHCCARNAPPPPACGLKGFMTTAEQASRKR